MTFEWFVARRYLVARRRQAFISLISLVSILGVTVGVTALIVALALMTGVQSELRDRIVGATAQLHVFKIGGGNNVEAEVERLLRVPGVVGAAPAIVGMGLMGTSARTFEPVSIKGIDPAREPSVTDIRGGMLHGTLDALNQLSPNGNAGVILGEELARKFDLAVGDSVSVMTPVMQLTILGPSLRPPRTLRVVGVFRLGFWEYDSSYALVRFDTAEQLLDKSGPDFVQLRVSDLDAAPRLREQLQEQLGAGYLVNDWTQLNKALYSALALEKIAISLTIGLIVMVAALNIVASLVLLVMEKSPDIAILRTMGASAKAIRRVFMYQGLVIGLVGTIAGTVLGLAVCLAADHYRLVRLDPDVYQIPYVPFRVLPFDIAVVVVSAVVVCYLATLYPSRQAGALDPAEALRNL